MNDHELLYLIKERNDDAYEIMYEKYQPLIYSKLIKFNIVESQREDFHQEGCKTLMEAIKKYDDKYSKSFTRFFELLLVRRFMALLNKTNKPIIYKSDIVMDFQEIKEEHIIYLTKNDIEMARNILNDLEYSIFYHHYVKERKISEVAKELKIPIKRVYNAIYRLKQKLRDVVSVA